MLANLFIINGSHFALYFYSKYNVIANWLYQCCCRSHSPETWDDRTVWLNANIDHSPRGVWWTLRRRGRWLFVNRNKPRIIPQCDRDHPSLDLSAKVCSRWLRVRIWSIWFTLLHSFDFNLQLFIICRLRSMNKSPNHSLIYRFTRRRILHSFCKSATVSIFKIYPSTEWFTDVLYFIQTPSTEHGRLRYGWTMAGVAQWRDNEWPTQRHGTDGVSRTKPIRTPVQLSALITWSLYNSIIIPEWKFVESVTLYKIWLLLITHTTQ